MSKKHKVGPVVDNSPSVPQRDKLKGKFEIKALNWTEKQKEFINIATDKNTNLMFVSGPAGSSKAQPLDADILTPNGWRKMGDIRVGDSIYTADGSTTKVLGVFPQGQKPIYRVTFSDDTSTECCGEHLWLTQTNNERYARTRIKGVRKRNARTTAPKVGKIRNTLEIKKTLLSKDARPNHYIPLCQPLNFPEADLPIHPYVLGAILGDGGISQKMVRFTSADPEIPDRISTLLPEGTHIKKSKTEIYGYSILDDKCSWIRPNRIKSALETLSLMGKKSDARFIPYIYKFNSIENRLELLRGLMDTDGTTSGGHSSFATTSPQLAKDIIFLIQSLGGTARYCVRKNFYTYKGERKRGLDSYNISVKLCTDINPFYLPRKRNRYLPSKTHLPFRSITKIEEVGAKECRCILVDNDSHLYLTNDCIVTHNTVISTFCALTMLNEHRISDILYVRAAVESADSKLGFLPGSLEEKISYYGIPFADKLDELLNRNVADALVKEHRVEILPVNYLRGVSWNAKYILVDEAQNLTQKELITILTRIGKFSKCIVMADPDQSDINGKSGGFDSLYSLLSDEESKKKGIFSFKFEEQDIMRSELTKYLVHKFKELKK